MGSGESSEITDLLRHLEAGDRSAVDRLFSAVYQELRNLAAQFFRREAKGNTLQPTALVHEAYVKLVDQNGADRRSRTHFFAVAGQAMRRFSSTMPACAMPPNAAADSNACCSTKDLVAGVQPNDDILPLDEALSKLAKLDSRQAQMVELRFFGCLERLGGSGRGVGSVKTGGRAGMDHGPRLVAAGA